MQVKSVEIRMPEYGDKAGQYVGVVRLEGESGKMEINLTPGDIGRIFGIIQSAAHATARQNAEMVKQSVLNAQNQTALIGHSIEV